MADTGHMEISSDDQIMLDAIGKWLEQKVRPVAAKLEHDDIYPTELVEDMIEMGLFAALISPDYGGLGLSATTYSRIVTQISEEWMSLTGIFNSHLMMAQIVERFGTDLQKEYWLPKFATGELRGGLALTEPNAGTDLQGILTRATRKGDKYIINGTKTWISNSIKGNCVALLTKTDPTAEPRYKGMSMFITQTKTVEGGVIPGVSNGNKLEKLGYKGIDSGELIYDNFECDADLCMVGTEEGQGFFMATGGLQLGRINVAARGVGIAKRALRESIAYSQTRKTMGKPICDHQAIQLKLGEMATTTRAAELLTQDAAAAYDRGGRVDMEAGMAKYFASEAALSVSTEAMRLHGGYGYSKEYPIERLFRDAPLLCIGEGTNEMQRIIIARQLVKKFPV